MYFGIYDVTSGNLDGYEAVQPLNGGDATLWGAEFSFNQQLTILPGALSGLGVYANYTWTDSDAGIIGRGDGNRIHDAQAQWDLSAAYAITRQAQIFLEVINLTDECL